MLVSGTLRNVIPALHLTHAIHIHPEFSPKSLENDIAVIELKSPVSKDIVTPVAIYSGNVTDDMSLVTAGWGEISAGVIGLSNSELKTATQSPSSSSVCKDANAIWSDNNKNLVCTLVKDGKSLASGDGGNPLAYINNGVNLLVGIASTTGRSESGADIRPEYTETNYYTHVYSYIDWIVNVTGLEKSYLLNTAVRPLPNYSTIGNVQTYGDYPISISASTILQNTGFTLVIFLSLVLVLLF
ncbi:Mannan-binding lectin serine protease 1 [Zancudomyces culisetae]|uniref:Mannan-binding lectin serine protease 1 n=1 Tax=Zancudomyces culisetae TaxID=1213189 RepID=A0A1R1PHE8_ZANCU|nr:Mannan-binding lectin serine protease 1 [Zancudomyces culisetae]|eukprot:OMH80401.1 Mannan-binding lectin serine protease 1 [Zancudomyces culisetae]